ncbi:UNVERIFIED_CONTAM: hypothetical protein BEN50_19055 [Euhalothece sp. KZN 001]
MANLNTNGTIIGTIIANDPEGQALQYDIATGNTNNAFRIENNNQIVVNDSGEIDPANDSFDLTVSVTDNPDGVADSGDEQSSFADVEINFQDDDNDAATGILEEASAEIDIDFNQVELDLEDGTSLVGTQESDFARGIAIDRGGNYYITGDTRGQFLEEDDGVFDIDNFAVRFGNNNPNPTDVAEGGDDGQQDIGPIQRVRNDFSDKLETNEQDGGFNVQEFNNGLGIIQNDGFSFTVTYSATQPEGNNPAVPVTELGGISLRMHFNSDNETINAAEGANPDPGLLFDGLDNIFTDQGSVQVPDEAQPDTDDFDNDPSTDAFVPITFFDSQFEWPGVESADLFDASFTTNAALTSGESNIRFSAQSTADGFEFGTNQAGTRDITITPNQYTFDVDGNGTVDLLTDGLQIFNAIANASGGGTFAQDEVIPQAIAGDGALEFDSDDVPNGAEAVDIFNYLQVGLNANPSNGNSSVFDIDGDNSTDLLTDGILLIRFLSGFEGNSLVDGALSVDATRTTAEDITGYINNFIPGATDGAEANA